MNTSFVTPSDRVGDPGKSFPGVRAIDRVQFDCLVGDDHARMGDHEKDVNSQSCLAIL